MEPTLSLGQLSISTYRLLRVIAVLVFFVAVFIRLRRGHWPVTGWDILLAVPFLQLGLLLGASLEVALPYLADYVLHGAPVPPGWWDGRRWLGALAGGALAGYVICRFRRLPVGRCFDLFAVPLPLALAVARAGCLLQGCCYGREATAWPALVLPDVHGVWASRYPTQPASILANLLIFVALLAVERYGKERVQGQTWPFDGFLFLLFVALHCGQRFVFEFWRADAPPLAGPFSWTHLYCAVGMGFAAWGIARAAARAHYYKADGR